MTRRRRDTLARTALALAIAAAAAIAVACYRPPPQSPAEEPGIGGRVADALLTEKVRVKLLDRLGTDALGVEIEAAGGRVRLSGTVAERSTQELAEEVARSVRGVRRVDNRIALELRRDRPGPVGRAAAETERELSDASLESRVKSKLLGELGRWALDVEVEAADGVVSLRGWVPDAARKRLALDAARDARGVERLVDLIRIGLEE
jgi:osmotically-inducible protein OsmY